MSRIGGDDEDTFPDSSELDRQAAAEKTTQERGKYAVCSHI